MGTIKISRIVNVQVPTTAAKRLARRVYLAGAGFESQGRLTDLVWVFSGISSHTTTVGRAAYSHITNLCPLYIPPSFNILTIPIPIFYLCG
jgi:hypothetical protein